jgi:hypothetical protein
VALAFPKLKLPNSPEQVAFRLVEQILRSDPLLSTTMRTLRAWRGEADDVQQVSFALCPFVRISPWAEPSTRRTETQHYMPMDIRIDISVGGSDFDQLFNFWGTVRTAIFPIVEPRRTQILDMSNAAEITRSQMIANGYKGETDNEGLRILSARGILQLILLVRTM